MTSQLDLHDSVHAFHLKYGHPVGKTPADIPADRMRFRMKLIIEELFELIEATYVEDAAGLRDDVDNFIKGATPRPRLVDQIDALVDMQYVIEGTAIELGVDLRPVIAEVHRSNMDKLVDPSVGKPVKPEGWLPPRIQDVIDAQRGAPDQPWHRTWGTEYSKYDAFLKATPASTEAPVTRTQFATLVSMIEAVSRRVEVLETMAHTHTSANP